MCTGGIVEIGQRMLNIELLVRRKSGRPQRRLMDLVKVIKGVWCSRK